MIYEQAKIAIENIKKQEPQTSGFVSFREGVLHGTPWIEIIYRDRLEKMFCLTVYSNDSFDYDSTDFNESAYCELVKTIGVDEADEIIKKMALNFLSKFTK